MPACGRIDGVESQQVDLEPAMYVHHPLLLVVSGADSSMHTDAEANARMDKSGNVHGVARDLSHGPGTTAHG